MSVAFSRANPSARYRELLAQYQLMHTHGEQHAQVPAEQTFRGQSLPRHAATIKQLIEVHDARTILDYGSGKGWQYREVPITADEGVFADIPSYWGARVTCYDPAYEPHSRLPEAKFDGVVCTDVLEHCPEQDVPWIVSELFGFAAKFVYANIACFPARKRLANGENAHCTIKSRAWWEAVIRPIASGSVSTRYAFCLDEPVAKSDGSVELQQRIISG